jgi:hypothetical protein
MPARSSSLSPLTNGPITGEVYEINLNSRNPSTLSLSAPTSPTLLHPETNLHLPLPLHVEDHHSIDLNDILDSGRRKSIIDSLDLRPFPEPPSRNSHKRGSSDSGRVGTPNPNLAWGHSRNRSAPMLGMNSGSVESLTSGRGIERENRGSMASLQSGGSFQSARTSLSARTSFGGGEGGFLQALGSLGRRDSPGSAITDVGLDDGQFGLYTEWSPADSVTAVLSQATWQSVPDMTRQASYHFLDEIRHGGYSPVYSPIRLERAA